jgi:hypothetical protein
LIIEVITATDTEGDYLECVPFFVKFWLEVASATQHSIRPRIIVIGESLPAGLETYSDYCEVFESDLPSSFVAQNIRCLMAGVSDADVVITSDVDMFPLSFGVFERALALADTSSEFVICRDVLPEGQYPICYNLASPKVWQKVFKTNSSKQAELQLKEIAQKAQATDATTQNPQKLDWFSDQTELYSRVEKHTSEGHKVRKLVDSATGHRRLDRTDHHQPIGWLVAPLVLFGVFSDYHIHRPLRANIFYIKCVFWATKVHNRSLRIAKDLLDMSRLKHSKNSEKRD